MRKSFFAAFDRSDTNRTVQTKKMTRGLKFRINEVEGYNYIYIYIYICRRTKTLVSCAATAANLRLRFRICKKERFAHEAAHIIVKLRYYFTEANEKVFRKRYFDTSTEMSNERFQKYLNELSCIMRKPAFLHMRS